MYNIEEQIFETKQQLPNKYQDYIKAHFKMHQNV